MHLGDTQGKPLLFQSTSETKNPLCYGNRNLAATTATHTHC